MCKEITIILVFGLGLLADFLWFQLTQTLGLVFIFQIVSAMLMIFFTFLAGKRYFAKHLYSYRKNSSFPTWKRFRLGSRTDLWKRQIPLTRI